MMDKINRKMAKKLEERLTQQYPDYEGLITIDLTEFNKVSEKTFGAIGFDIYLSEMQRFKFIVDRVTQFFKDELTFTESHALDVTTDVRYITLWSEAGICVSGFARFTPRNLPIV